MRQTQIIGLSPQAVEFLKTYEQVSMSKCSCPDCKHLHISTSTKTEYKDASSYGMFDDGPTLYKYLLMSGEYVYEYVQACPWSSGPCIYIALAVNDYVKDGTFPNAIEVSLWNNDTIREA